MLIEYVNQYSIHDEAEKITHPEDRVPVMRVENLQTICELLLEDINAGRITNAKHMLTLLIQHCETCS